MIKGHGVYIDSINFYVILASKVKVYEKKTHKLIGEIKVKNPSKVISDLEINALIICTTKTTVFVFSQKTYNLEFKIELLDEAFDVLYDKKNHELYAFCNNLKKNETIIYKINIDLKEYISNTIPKLIIQQPIKVDANNILLLCNYIADHASNQYFISKYDKSNLNFIENLKKITKFTNLKILDEEWCSNVWDGFENIKTGEVVLYKDIGLKEECYYITKKINNFFIVSDHKKAYLLSNDFKIVKIFIENDYKKNMHDFALDDGNIYIIKGDYLYVEKL